MSEVPWCDYNPVTVVKITLDYDASGVPHNLLADPCTWVCEPQCFYFSDCVPGEQIRAAAAADGAAVRPLIATFQTQGQRLQPGRSMSSRGTVAICFTDELIDPKDQCGGGAISQWIEDQQFWENRLLEVWYGDCDQSLEEMEKETYLIESAVPAGSDCRACIIARDPLSLLDTTSNTVPSPCPLAFTLSTTLDAEFEVEEETGEVLRDPFIMINRFILSSNIPVDDPDVDCLLCTQFVCVSGELLRVAPVFNDATLLSPDNAFGPPGYNLVLLERGSCGTQRTEITAGSQLQPALSYEQCHVADVLVDLIQARSNFQDVTLTCCDSAPVIGISCESVEEFRCKHPLNIVDRAIICPSVQINELLNELAMENLLSVYYNNADQQLVIAPLCPAEPGEDVAQIEECMIVEDSLQYRPGTVRYNRVIVGYAPNDWTAGTGNDNYSNVAEDGDPEILYNDAIVEPCTRRRYRTEKVLRHNSRFMGECGQYRAETMAAQQCVINSLPNDELSIQTHPNTACDIPLGTQFTINHPKLSPIQRQQQWTLVSKARSGERNWCIELQFEQIFPTTQPISLGFECEDGEPNLSDADISVCDANCLIQL